MSDVPIWSRDVTNLLNPEASNNWRLLASGLGYTKEDITTWETQSDPCMGLLSDCYATHGTKEATKRVLNVLRDINRSDAAAIFENSLKAEEHIAVGTAFEYPIPPPVFLSYHWNQQNEVKLLCQHLQMAGYECWMDIGQMGGGYKLLEAIESGIKDANVVICCMSEDYAKSPNSNREVNIAVDLQKPIIPLQMDQMSWPPSGTMGGIFSEYLSINFYSGASKGVNLDKESFQELLMQLQYHGVSPDNALISAEYKNWWTIITEEKQDTKTTTTSKAKKEETEKGKSPEIFLSYQWGKLIQTQALHQRLTGLGFQCWMDIYHMGDDESLCEKVDRAVQGCKVILSLVTEKYTLSANCRREVNLANALKKPIIPLLLEETEWLPKGPMSEVFKQLQYINFSNDPEIQIKWTGKEFDELLGKLLEFLPTEKITISEASKIDSMTPPRASRQHSPISSSASVKESMVSLTDLSPVEPIVKTKQAPKAVTVLEPVKVHKSLPPSGKEITLADSKSESKPLLAEPSPLKPKEQTKQKASAIAISEPRKVQRRMSEKLLRERSVSAKNMSDQTQKPPNRSVRSQSIPQANISQKSDTRTESQSDQKPISQKKSSSCIIL